MPPQVKVSKEKINTEETYEVFEEVEPEISSITSLNIGNKKMDISPEEEQVIKEQEEVVIDHTDVVLKPKIEVNITSGDKNDVT